MTQHNTNELCKNVRFPEMFLSDAHSHIFLLSFQQEAFSYLLQSMKGIQSSNISSDARALKTCNQSKEFFEDLTVELQVIFNVNLI